MKNSKARLAWRTLSNVLSAFYSRLGDAWVGGWGGFSISSYYSRCHFLKPLCLCFVWVRRKNSFNVLMWECKAFKGYRNCWSLLLNVSLLSAGAFKRLYWLQTQTRWIFHPFLKGLFFSAFFSGFLLWSTVARCCFWFWIWCGRLEVSSLFLLPSFFHKS